MREILTRGVAQIYPSVISLEKLLKKKKLNIYCGYDPTGPNLHLGHLITLLKLADFQKLGHKVIMLVGDFTGIIGDPDKKDVRKKLTRKEVLFNQKSYKKTAGKFLNFSGNNPARLLHNSKWNSKLSFTEVIELASNFTVGQMIVRDMFQERIKRKKPIYLHEFLYPLIQANDSVVMNIDLEVGGSDQLFNMLCGRDLVRALQNREKFVLTIKLLTDSLGKKMGKTEGNMVNLNDDYNLMYGKIMSWNDELIIPAFESLTRIPMKDIVEMEKKMNPIEIKSVLAKEIISMCHSSKKAALAEEEFNNVFRKKQLPSKVKEVKLKEKALTITELLVKIKLANSKAEGRRLIEQGGVKIDGKIKDDWKEVIKIDKKIVVSVGKRRVIRVVKN